MAAGRLKRILGLGLIAGTIYVWWHRSRSRPAPAPRQLLPGPPVTASPTEGPDDRPAERPDLAAAVSWVEPEDGACPVSHPVKAKLSSGIFHVPGAQMYDRTKADRCYPDPAAAEADGLRASKR